MPTISQAQGSQREPHLIQPVLEDVEVAGHVVGRLMHLTDGWIRAFWRDPVPAWHGSKMLNLVYCGMYRSGEQAYKAILKRQGADE